MNFKRDVMTLFYLLSTVCLMALIGLYVYLCPSFDEDRFNSIAFHPLRRQASEKPPSSLNGSKVEEHFFVSKNGNILNGWFIGSPDSTKVVLFSHGNAGNLTHRIAKLRTLLSQGLSVFIYDYQGYGKSEGSPSLAGIIEDATAAFDYLHKTKNYSGDQIIIYGESIGTGVSGCLSKLRSGAALILESPFISIEYVAKEKLPILKAYPDFLFPSPHLNNLDVVKSAHPPLLIIAGEKDTVIPSRHGKLLFERAVSPKMLALLSDNAHNDIGILDPETYRESLKKFFQDYKLIQ
jgi:uncharacterized protein